MECPLCRVAREAGLKDSSGLVAAFPDAFPLHPGHTLIVPLRHEADFLELTKEERAGVLELIWEVSRRIQEEQAPDGLNIGVNVGEAAGQTIDHAHVHVIPRHDGDVPDPRGGIRWVLPERAIYWNPDD